MLLSLCLAYYFFFFKSVSAMFIHVVINDNVSTVLQAHYYLIYVWAIVIHSRVMMYIHAYTQTHELRVTILP